MEQFRPKGSETEYSSTHTGTIPRRAPFNFFQGYLLTASCSPEAGMHLGLGFTWVLKFFFKIVSCQADVHCSEAELSTLAMPQKEVKMGPRASRAYCHSQAWAPGLTPPAQPGRDPGRQLVGGRKFHQLEQQQQNYISNLYIQAINRPLASKESGRAPLPASKYTLLASICYFLSPALQKLPEHKGSWAFLLPGPLWQPGEAPSTMDT